ncbi:hypothetical protein LEP1GSC058_0120 [Leptospira fainei serovar Hurstbridge str. BUT 6]|uniref:Uncharacterized protein n=1 Tax=Leptospira fainei serovar Hurstbridge str. BUT 6 TaxID=1193011 RepID=S3UXG0_9LEPT|nr:hypothetical protein LEP1GSC058_0120 [Leptospira fainei serovar Hurstbridge str. BUT 6]
MFTNILFYTSEQIDDSLMKLNNFDTKRLRLAYNLAKSMQIRHFNTETFSPNSIYQRRIRQSDLGELE